MPLVKKSSNSPKPAQFTVTIKAPASTHLVFSGGGAKGAVYPEALIALGNDFLKNIESVSCASVGAIIGAIFSLGATPEALKEIVQRTDMMAGLDFSPSREGLFTTHIMKEIVQDVLCTEFLQRINEANAILDTSEWEDNSDRKKLKKSLKALQLECNETHDITFRMHEKLRSIYSQLLPGHNVIKAFYTCAVDIQEGKPIIFSAKETPDLSLSDVIALSAAFPRVFQPREIEIGSENKKFTDGGTYRNTPFKLRPNKFCSDHESNATVLAFVLGDEEHHDILHRPSQGPTVGMRIKNKALDKFCYNVPAAQGLGENDNDIYSYGCNVIPLNVGGLGTVSFNASPKQKDKAARKAKASVERFLDDRENQGYLIQGDLIECILKAPSNRIGKVIWALKKQGITKAEIAIAKEIKRFRVNNEEALTSSILAGIDKCLLQERTAWKPLLKNIRRFCNVKIPANDSGLSWEQPHKIIQIERLYNGAQDEFKRLFSVLSLEEIQSNQDLFLIYQFTELKGLEKEALSILERTLIERSPLNSRLLRKAVMDIKSLSSQELVSPKFLKLILEVVQNYRYPVVFWRERASNTISQLEGIVDALCQKDLILSLTHKEILSEMLTYFKELPSSVQKSKFKAKCLEEAIDCLIVIENVDSTEEERREAQRKCDAFMEQIPHVDLEERRTSVITNLLNLFKKIKRFISALFILQGEENQSEEESTEKAKVEPKNWLGFSRSSL